MNRRYLIIVQAVVFAFITLSCQLSGIYVDSGLGTTVRGSGNVVEETRSIRGVRGVDLATIGHVIIQLGDEDSLRIETEDNLMQYFDTQVRGGILLISTTPGSTNLQPTEPVLFYLTVERLDSVSISGSGDIQGPDLVSDDFEIDVGGSGDISLGNLTADQIDINIGGSGDVTLGNLSTEHFEISIGGSGEVRTGSVNVPTFEVDIHGSGDIGINELSGNDLKLDVNGSGDLVIDAGQVDDQEINIDGSGNFRAEDLSSKTVDVRVGGSGNIAVWVSDSLNVDIFGSGDVRYYGRPAVSSRGNGSGDIISMGDK
jgi:hypothetical protein